jgi:hypothetical protein
MGGHLVGIAAGFEHAMAGHDDHKRIAGNRLRHRISGAGRAGTGGDLAIIAGFAARNGAREVVNTPMESRYVIHVERDVGKVAGLAAQQPDDAFDCDFDVRWRVEFRRLGIQPKQAAAGFDLAASGNCTPTTPISLDAMPHRPMAVSKTLYHALP